MTELPLKSTPPAPTGPMLGDAFGAVLMDCWQGGAQQGQVLAFVERDDGDLDACDASRYFAGPEAWSPLGRWACAHARGRVLDIGSGAGRHALHLQSQGLEVVALDISPLAVELCRLRGVREVASGTVFDLAATEVRPFNAFLMLGNNLGLLGDAENARNLLGDVRRDEPPATGDSSEAFTVLISSTSYPCGCVNFRCLRSTPNVVSQSVQTRDPGDGGKEQPERRAKQPARADKQRRPQPNRVAERAAKQCAKGDGPGDQESIASGHPPQVPVRRYVLPQADDVNVRDGHADAS
jgi:SAM-dependent methyltransferase